MDKYINYIKLLEEKNIILYDFQKRISYYRLNNLNKEQIGGGKKLDLNKLDDYKIEKIIINLLNNNIDFLKMYLENCPT